MIHFDLEFRGYPRDDIEKKKKQFILTLWNRDTVSG
jgi:hypothetical protein